MPFRYSGRRYLSQIYIWLCNFLCNGGCIGVVPHLRRAYSFYGQICGSVPVVHDILWYIAYHRKRGCNYRRFTRKPLFHCFFRFSILFISSFSHCQATFCQWEKFFEKNLKLMQLFGYLKSIIGVRPLSLTHNAGNFGQHAALNSVAERHAFCTVVPLRLSSRVLPSSNAEP